MSKPVTVTRPDEAVLNPAIMRMVVVLPAPLGPRKPTISPLSTENVRSWTMVLEPNRLETDSRVIAAVGVFIRFVGNKKAPRRGPSQAVGDRTCLLVPAGALGSVLFSVVGHEQLRAFEVAHHFQAVDRLAVVLNAVVQTGGGGVHGFPASHVVPRGEN